MLSLKWDGVYTSVMSGDTSWASLSNRAFGDPTYASILAAYSGTPLIPGQSINLIQTLNAYNKAQDFSPYERLMSAIYNSLNPAVKTPQPPPPPPPHHESFWDEVIGIVVAVVVMIVAPEAVGALAFSAAFSAAGLATLTAGQLAIAYAVGGALADMATQGVAIAFNDQHGFSVQSMVENAIAAGATAGLSKALKIEGLLSEEHPEYVKAFAESAAIGTTVQLFQLGMGLRNKIDWKFIVEQAGATVLSSKLNKGLSNAPGIIRHTADEAANTALASTLGQKPDLTALAGNVLGDEAGDSADLIANRVSQSHHTASIGKSSSPSRYAEHARATHVASHSARESMQDDDGVGDLYDAYKSGLQHDVNAMAESQFNSAMAFDGHDADMHRVTQQNHHSDTGCVNWISHEIYEHQNSLWARGIMGFAGAMNSNAMHIALNAVNTVTRDLMGGVAGSYGTRYFDDLQNGRSTFSDAMHFVGAELDVQALGEVGGVALGYASRFVSETLPGVAKNMQSLFGRDGVEEFVNTGGRQLKSARAVLDADKEAEKFYEMIRSNPLNNDVALISKNTEMPEFQVHRIKQHLFFNKHLLPNGKIDRFDPYIEISDSWQRLQSGDFVKQDLDLLRHEYFESRFESLYQADYRTAHNAAILSGREWNPDEFISVPNMIWRL